METNREVRARIVREWLFGGEPKLPMKEQMEVVFEAMDFAEWLAERRRFINQMERYGHRLSDSDKELVVKVMKALAR